MCKVLIQRVEELGGTVNLYEVVQSIGHEGELERSYVISPHPVSVSLLPTWNVTTCWHYPLPQCAALTRSPSQWSLLILDLNLQNHEPKFPSLCFVSSLCTLFHNSDGELNKKHASFYKMETNPFHLESGLSDSLLTNRMVGVTGCHSWD